MEGARAESTLGRLVLGRSPGAGGFLLTGDDQVSRHHGELALEGGRVIYRNLSPNGSLLHGRSVESTTAVAPGDVLEIGSHQVEIRFELDEREQRDREEGRALWQIGPLARPAVRLALVIYLVALAGVVLLATGGGDDDLGSQWDETRRNYRSDYHPEAVGEAALAERLEEAERLVGRLMALERSERWGEARLVCRRLMAIDRDPTSPVYRFAAKRLGALSEER